MCIYVYMHRCTCIYIYIERERDILLVGLDHLAGRGRFAGARRLGAPEGWRSQNGNGDHTYITMFVSIYCFVP